MRRLFLILAAAALASAFTTMEASADWDMGDAHKMHYPQLPIDLINPDLEGVDVAFMNGRLADDWMCSSSGPVNDIHFWVSWKSNEVMPIDYFWVRIWSNNPMGPGGYSIPGILLWERPFQIGEVTVRPMPEHIQGWYDPLWQEFLPQNHYRWHQINIVDIPEPFIQQEGTLYWLEIEMPMTPTIGWKVSGSPQFEDTAVFWRGADWGAIYNPFTGAELDLSFVITGEEIVGCWLCCPLEGYVLMNPAGSSLSSVDFDQDFDVDVVDFARFVPCLYSPYDPCCDFNCDGASNIADFAIFASHYQHAGTVHCQCP